MVPFVELPPLHLGPIVVDPFSTLVVIGVLVGIFVARRRCLATGLDPTFGERLMWHAIGVGFVLSHVLDVLAYHPEQVLEDPLVLLRVWGSQSSFAGMLGGLLGMAIFFARHGAHLGLRERLAYVDTIAYGFPFAWIFGRLGCTFALDHPGAVTSFPLATSLETDRARAFLRSVYAEAGRLSDLPGDDALACLGFHNLGFYELVYTVLVIVPAMRVLARKPRAPGFFLATFLLVYAPIRFVADFLRIGDRTYAGLTFGQYAAVGLTIGAAYLAHRTRHAAP